MNGSSKPRPRAKRHDSGADREAGESEILVFWTLRPSECSQCKTSLPAGDFLIMEGGQPWCLACADLDHLVFLERGDAALTRRARKRSKLSAVVVQFSRSRKRYERQGLLVEQEALEQAEQECLSDADQRARKRERDALRRVEEDKQLVERMTAEILHQFPGCPAREARAIARHTAERGSGRVGRTAAGRALEEGALRAAVIAAIRHNHTEYDFLLMQGVDRHFARERVSDDVEEVLAKWESP